MSQEVFINTAEQIIPVGAPPFAQGSANTFRMGFLSWDQIIGTIIELPCACAFQVITSFAEQVIPHGHAWEIDVDTPTDPPDLSLLIYQTLAVGNWLSHSREQLKQAF